MLSGPGDTQVHRFFGDALAESPTAVDTQQGPGIHIDLVGLIGLEHARFKPGQVVGQHAHPMGVVARQIGAHQMIGHDGGFLGVAAGGDECLLYQVF